MKYKCKTKVSFSRNLIFMLRWSSLLYVFTFFKHGCFFFGKWKYFSFVTLVTFSTCIPSKHWNCLPGLFGSNLNYPKVSGLWLAERNNTGIWLASQSDCCVRQGHEVQGKEIFLKNYYILELVFMQEAK